MNKKLLYGTIAIVLLVCIGLAYGMYHVRANTRPDIAVERFYSTWLETAQREGSERPIELKLHEKSTYVTDDFRRAAERAHSRGEDYVMCGTSVPESFAIEQVNTNDEDTRTTILLFLDDRLARVFLVRDEKNWWRIDEIDCENPEYEEDTTATSTPSM